MLNRIRNWFSRVFFSVETTDLKARKLLALLDDFPNASCATLADGKSEPGVVILSVAGRPGIFFEVRLPGVGVNAAIDGGMLSMPIEEPHIKPVFH